MLWICKNVRFAYIVRIKERKKERRKERTNGNWETIEAKIISTREIDDNQNDTETTVFLSLSVLYTYDTSWRLIPFYSEYRQHITFSDPIRCTHLSLSLSLSSIIMFDLLVQLIMISLLRIYLCLSSEVHGHVRLVYVWKQCVLFDPGLQQKINKIFEHWYK